MTVLVKLGMFLLLVLIQPFKLVITLVIMIVVGCQDVGREFVNETRLIWRGQ